MAKTKRRSAAAKGAAWTDAIADAQRAVVVAVVFLLPLVYSQSARDPFTTPKLFLVLGGAGVLLALQTVRSIGSGAVTLPWRSTGGIAAALMVALAAAATAAGWDALALWGAYGRETGFLPYVAGVVFFLVALRRFDSRTAWWLVVAVLAGGGIMAVVAILQRFDVALLPFTVREDLVGTNGTMANPNFASGYLGLAFPLAAAGGLAARSSGYRMGAALAGAVLLGGLLATDSMQGWLAAGAGTIFVLVVGATALRGRGRQVVFAGLAGAAIVGIAVIVIGLGGSGPIAALNQQSALALRLSYWGTAAGMWLDNPVFGVGLDHFTEYYRQYRPVQDALSNTVTNSADAAHSVPFMMLSGGGVVLASAVVAFLAMVGAHLVKGLRDSMSMRRWQLAALGGAWVAYWTQAAVSMDVPPLLATHFCIAGGIVGVANRAPLKELRLPWADRAQRRRSAAPFRIAGVGIGLVVAMAAITGALIPVRADMAAARGSALLANEQPVQAAGEFQRAVNIMPGRTVYGVLLGGALYQAEQFDAALTAFEAAAESQPRNFEALMWSARTAAQLGEESKAKNWYDAALTVEPVHPELKVEVARYHVSIGDNEAAERLIAAALAVDPGHAAALELQESL